jgi:hypothetical protein
MTSAALRSSSSCPCHIVPEHGTTTHRLCVSCVRRALAQAQDRRAHVLADWTLAREECWAALQQSNTDSSCGLAERQEQSRCLRARVERLGRRSAAAAVEVCAVALKNEQRQQQLRLLSGSGNTGVPGLRENLQRMEQFLLEQRGGAMVQAIEEARLRVRAHRFQWACAAFVLHRLAVEEKDKIRLQKSNTTHTHARVIGKLEVCHYRMLDCNCTASCPKRSCSRHSVSHGPSSVLTTCLLLSTD